MINNREEIKIGSYRHMPIESPVDIFLGGHRLVRLKMICLNYLHIAIYNSYFSVNARNCSCVNLFK